MVVCLLSPACLECAGRCWSTTSSALAAEQLTCLPPVTASFSAGGFITENFTRISLFMLGPPLIAHPASETDISGWTLKVDINFLLVYFYPWCVLQLKYRTSAIFLCTQWFSLGLRSVPFFFLIMLRYVCFLTKLWSSGDHEIHVPGWLANNTWSTLSASLFGEGMRMGKGVSISS